MINSTQKPMANIPHEIFKKFLEEIEKSGIQNDLVQRLRESYQRGAISESDLKKALLPDESEL